MADTPIAFCSQKNLTKSSLIKFYISKSFILPDELKTCSIPQFENVLTFASKLIGLENSISNEFTRDSLFAEYLITSGLVMNKKNHWITFHGGVDFGYILKQLMG
jgi:hypothetical protein